jgi:hypothetical protein
MKCDPWGTYMKYDERSGLATLIAPKGPKKNFHKCYLKQWNDKMSKTLNYTITLHPDVVAPTKPTGLCKVSTTRIPKSMKAGMKGVAHVVTTMVQNKEVPVHDLAK